MELIYLLYYNLCDSLIKIKSLIYKMNEIKNIFLKNILFIENLPKNKTFINDEDLDFKKKLTKKIILLKCMIVNI